MSQLLNSLSNTLAGLGGINNVLPEDLMTPVLDLKPLVDVDGVEETPIQDLQVQRTRIAMAVSGKNNAYFSSKKYIG